MVAEDVDISDYYWGFKTKVKLEVGLKNTVNPDLYGDIIWFNQGVYILTNFSTVLNTTSYTINLSGKDKMCLLNGEVGGTINATTDFGQYEQTDEDGNVTIKKYPIKDIIRDSVHQYGNEPFHNIIINDVDDLGLELLEYRYDEPMYLIRESLDDTYFNGTFDGTMQCWLLDGTATTLAEIPYYDSLMTSLEPIHEATPIRMEGSDRTYCVAKIEYGETAGYRTTPLVYPTDLISQIGESLTQMLDKIVTMLGDFEYFYDLDGRFTFQRKKTFVDTAWSPAIQNEDEEAYVDSLAITSADTYTFNGSELITAFNNTPNLANLRNDFAVWGKRAGLGGTDVPVHMRYAIDEKPTRYVAIDGTIYTTADEGTPIYEKVPTFHPDWWRIDDWAEYYRILTGHYPDDIMQKYAPRGSDAFLIDDLLKLLTPEPQYVSSWNAQRNSYVHVIDVDKDGLLMYNRHGTGCSHNFQEFLNWMSTNGQVSYIYKPSIPDPENIKMTHCDWREIIYQMSLDYRKYNHGVPAEIDSREPDFEIKLAELNAPLYPNGVTGYEQYYIDMEGFWRQLYNPAPSEDEYDEYYDISDKDHPCWSKTVYEAPESLNFWIDFLPDGELDQFSCKMVGDRPKAVNEDSVKAIYYRETPLIIFTTPEKLKSEEPQPGYRYFQAANLEAMFSVSTQGICAKDRVDQLLYQHGYCIESATITIVPVYYLQPNTRIQINDEKSGIRGDYIVEKLTIPLAYNGTMSVTATKAADRVDARRVM